MRFYDWRMDAVKGGRGYHVDIGAFSTPIQGGGAGTVFVQAEPEGIISCPTGTVIIPIRIHVVCQMPIMAADSNESEILIAVDKAAILAGGSGVATAETPVNMHTGSSNTSLCTCKSATTTAYTSPTLGMELGHAVRIADFGDATGQSWGELSLLYEPITPPILVGPCAIYIYWGGTVATTGFAQVEWIELASA